MTALAILYIVGRVLGAIDVLPQHSAADDRRYGWYLSGPCQ